ncbi:hypothetical protein D3C72_2105070 [compost metagenome]
MNEYKAGDIVKGVRRMGHGTITTGEVVDVGEGLNVGVNSFSDGAYRSVDVTTLIVPVEQRFDRAEAGKDAA